MSLSNETGGRPLSTPGRQVLEDELRALLVTRRHAEGQRTQAIRDAANADHLLRHSWPRLLALCGDLRLTTCQAEELLRAREASAQVYEQAVPSAEAPEVGVYEPDQVLFAEVKR